MIRFTAARYDEIAQRIGYCFKDKALLRHALTHASSKRKHGDYERLEFLGDRVLGLVIAEDLFRAYPGQREGHMSGRHSQLVRGDTCAQAGRALALEDFIVMGQHEMTKGLNLNATVLGDVMEALIAAIYLDGGIDAARAFILRNWRPFMDLPETMEKDAKTFLQEWALGRALPIPAYAILSREGPEHAPRFVVRVTVAGREPMQGTGTSKRLAEQDAAAKFLAREKIRA
ncbi:MAG: ribonuclease III [Aestuariivirga sp.]